MTLSLPAFGVAVCIAALCKLTLPSDKPPTPVLLLRATVSGLAKGMVTLTGGGPLRPACWRSVAKPAFVNSVVRASHLHPEKLRPRLLPAGEIFLGESTLRGKK
ncbi:hypothetical protein E2C01_054943 [Portunus trituberculatus]|uniref:Secreted protein n=1 Tax=Portunus trituberculatus TaxID=210409 RepID=A0A5B7GTD9_PORTR|nr:hypothetical protein [Portunus trituberculatus]